MKTELTYQMESRLSKYKPRILSGIELAAGKSAYCAFEVPVMKITGGNGIVDCVLVSEYWRDKQTIGECMLMEFPDGEDTGTPYNCAMNLPEGSEIPQYCKAESCEWLRKSVYGVKTELIVCIELKASVSDFHSIHGHNFIGNLNYYLMPENIYGKVKDDIKQGIGVLLYSNTGRRIRETAASDYTELKSFASKELLLSVIKASRRM